MPLFNIPQFIDVEDKIVGPLTAKQLGWMAAAGVILLVSWSIFDTSAFAMSAIIIGPIFGALAFYKPNGQPLISFVFASFSFVLRPKLYIWRRVPEKSILQSIPEKKTNPKKDVKIVKNTTKTVSNQSIEDISKILDNK